METIQNIVKEPVATYNQNVIENFNYSSEKKLEPIVKWAGGKEKELKYIIPNLPDNFKCIAHGYPHNFLSVAVTGLDGFDTVTSR